MPKYKLIAAELRTKIENGDYGQDRKMLTEGEYSDIYGVSRQTIRQALDLLEAEGLIYRRQGSGTFVGQPPRKWTPTRTVGVIAPMINDYIFPSILRAIESTLSQQGYCMELLCTNERVDVERRALQGFLTRPVDGLLINGTKTALPSPNIRLYQELSKRDIPMVFFNAAYLGMPQEAVCIVPDEEEGTNRLMDYLVSQGCTKIGGLFDRDDIQGIQRYQAYAQALFAKGLDFSDDLVMWHTAVTKRTFLDSPTETMRNTLLTCDGFLCYNDEISLYLIRTLRTMGREMPVIASFDDSILRKTTDVPFASIRHPKERLGEEAAQALITLMKGDPVRSQRIPWGEIKK